MKWPRLPWRRATPFIGLMAAVDAAVIRDRFTFPADVEGYLSEEEGTLLYLMAALDVPENGVIVELGTYKGRSAICLGQSGRDVHCVDHFEGEANVGAAHFDHIAGGYFDEACRNFERYNLTPFIHQYDSLTAAAGFAPESVDLLFVDAAHDELSVRADFAAWTSRVKPGGIVAFHDMRFAGPKAVVRDALASGRWNRHRAVDGPSGIIAIKKTEVRDAVPA